MFKICSRCKKERKLTDFTKCKANKDGLDFYCKDCKKQYSIEYLATKNGKIKHKRSSKIYIKNNPGKLKIYNKKAKAKGKPIWQNAHKILFNALKNKIILKQPCLVCGNKNVHGHHEDYTKPLDVIWLCHKHHFQLHKSMRLNERILKCQQKY